MVSISWPSQQGRRKEVFQAKEAKLSNLYWFLLYCRGSYLAGMEWNGSSVGAETGR